MKQVIVITGASSGFGALTARALVQSGHTVCASMRETTSRNAAHVQFDRANQRGARPHIAPPPQPVSDRVRAEPLRRIGFADLLTPRDLVPQ